jgi:predicted nucleic acid-binding protein
VNLVIDASVAIKMLVVEEDHEAALALAENAGNALVAPDFVLVETGNVLGKKVRTRQISVEQAESAIADLLVLFHQLIPTTELLSAASATARELDHPLYDCLTSRAPTGSEVVS